MTLTARTGETLQKLAWTLPPNATAETAIGTPLPTGITPASGATSAELYLRRVSGQSVTLPIVVTGSFGTWNTLVGGGPNAWGPPPAGQGPAPFVPDPQVQPSYRAPQRLGPPRLSPR